MKITDIQAYPVYSQRGGRNFLFVVVDTDEGIYGVGEAGITWKELAIMGVIDHYRPILVGQDPFRIEHIWQIMYRTGFFPAGNITAAAAAAIDIALWDIKGKALGVPVYELLGGRTRDKVVVYPHNNGATVEQLVESCLKSVEAGYKFVRWGLPQNGEQLEPTPAVLESIKQFEAVRSAVGPEIELCFDIHTRLDPVESIQLCNAVEQYRPFFIEDPIRAESMQSLRLVRQQTRVPIAVGEQFASKWEFRQVIEEELTDYARIDLSIAGGITEAKKIAGWCETHYIKLAVHNPLGPVSTAACLHLNLACPLVAVQEQPRTPGTVLTDVVPVQVPFERGYLLPPTAPGLGIEFDREAAKKYPLHVGDRSMLTRADGSVTNW